jgi:hypothetical protein
VKGRATYSGFAAVQRGGPEFAAVESLVAALADAGQITGKPEVIGSSTGLVPTNALVLTELINSRTLED